MKRKASVIFCAVLILFLAAYFYLKTPTVTPPERLPNIPPQAEWVGGSDGGRWYQITKVVSKNTLKIKIYNDGDGELEIDTTFILNPECPFKQIDSATLIKSINGYDGNSIGLLLPKKGRRCYLIVK